VNALHTLASVIQKCITLQVVVMAAGKVVEAVATPRAAAEAAEAVATPRAAAFQDWSTHQGRASCETISVIWGFLAVTQAFLETSDLWCQFFT
jgi:hypothetical protein